MHLQPEALNHHECGEHHEYLPTGTVHEHQGVVKPIGPPQHGPRSLAHRRFDSGICEQDEEGDKDGRATSGEIHRRVGQIEGFPCKHDRAESDQTAGGACAHDPSKHARRLVPMQPLQLQGVVYCLVIVKPDGTDDRRDADAPE